MAEPRPSKKCESLESDESNHTLALFYWECRELPEPLARVQLFTLVPSGNLCGLCDHLQPCCFGPSFRLIIQGLNAFGKTALSVPGHCPFNARLLKNPLKLTRTQNLLSARNWMMTLIRAGPLK